VADGPAPRTALRSGRRHIFCTDDIVADEVRGCLRMRIATYERFGLDMRLELSTRPEQRVGNDEMWDRASEAREHARGDASTTSCLGRRSFYGPRRVALHMTDSLGRSSLGRVHVDYPQPQRFQLTYAGAINSSHASE